MGMHNNITFSNQFYSESSLPWPLEALSDVFCCFSSTQHWNSTVRARFPGHWRLSLMFSAATLPLCTGILQWGLASLATGGSLWCFLQLLFHSALEFYSEGSLPWPLEALPDVFCCYSSTLHWNSTVRARFPGHWRLSLMFSAATPPLSTGILQWGLASLATGGSLWCFLLLLLHSALEFYSEGSLPWPLEALSDVFCCYSSTQHWNSTVRARFPGHWRLSLMFSAATPPLSTGILQWGLASLATGGSLWCFLLLLLHSALEFYSEGSLPWPLEALSDVFCCFSSTQHWNSIVRARFPGHWRLSLMFSAATPPLCTGILQWGLASLATGGSLWCFLLLLLHSALEFYSEGSLPWPLEALSDVFCCFSSTQHWNSIVRARFPGHWRLSLMFSAATPPLCTGILQWGLASLATGGSLWCFLLLLFHSALEWLINDEKSWCNHPDNASQQWEVMVQSPG